MFHWVPVLADSQTTVKLRLKTRVSGELLRGPILRQITPRKGDASPFLNGLGDSETIGAAKRTATKSANTA